MNWESIILMANFALLFIAYVVILLFFRKVSNELIKLDTKQQSTIYGVSHVWGSLKELRDEIKVNLPNEEPIEHEGVVDNE